MVNFPFEAPPLELKHVLKIKSTTSFADDVVTVGSVVKSVLYVTVETVTSVEDVVAVVGIVFGMTQAIAVLGTQFELIVPSPLTRGE
jgi:hypothetical protein